MKSIAFLAEKGGAGKTTHSYNFGEYLAALGHKVLLIDLDQQGSLSVDIYGKIGTNTSSANLFRNEVTEIFPIKDNLDLIPYSLSIDLLEQELLPKEMRALTLNFWFQDFYDKLHLDKYDYIIFDTHPDFRIVNQNIVAFCDSIISPLEPGILGWAAKPKIEARIDWLKKQVIDPFSRESMISTDLSFFNNMVDHLSTDSKELLEKTFDDPSVLTTIPKKQLIMRSVNRNVPIIEMYDDKSLRNKHEKFFNQFLTAYSILKDHVDSL